MQPTTITETPDDPMGIMGKMHFITTIGAGIMLARNWKKLGKPEWVGTTTTMALIIPLGAIGLLFAGFFALTSLKMNTLLIYPLAFTAFGANVGFVWSLAWLQNGGYKQWKKDGAEALARHDFNVQNGVVMFLAVLLVGLVIGIVLAMLNR